MRLNNKTKRRLLKPEVFQHLNQEVGSTKQLLSASLTDRGKSGDIPIAFVSLLKQSLPYLHWNLSIHPGVCVLIPLSGGVLEEGPPQIGSEPRPVPAEGCLTRHSVTCSMTLVALHPEMSKFYEWFLWIQKEFLSS